jgi:hypothetical protein
MIGWTAEGEGDEYYLGPPEEEDAALTDPPQVVSELRSGAMGVQVDWNVDTGGWSTVLTMARPLDVGWVKLQVSWSAMQPESGGQLGGEFSKFQASLQDAKNQGYKVLVTISKAPGWARLTDRSEDGPPDDPKDLARFIGLLLDQVGENVDAIEVWNEPNLQREWTGSLPFSGQGYMQLFEPAYERIRDYSDSIRVVTAGLAPTTNTLVSVDDRSYLRQMYDAGLADFEDVAVGIHPYGWGNPPEKRCCDPIEGRSWDDQPQFFFLDNIADYRGIMLAYDHDRAKLWATEFGWTSWEDFTIDPPEPWMATARSPPCDARLPDRPGLNFISQCSCGFHYAITATVANRTGGGGYSLVFMDAGSTVRARPVACARHLSTAVERHFHTIAGRSQIVQPILGRTAIAYMASAILGWGFISVKVFCESLNYTHRYPNRSGAPAVPAGRRQRAGADRDHDAGQHRRPAHHLRRRHHAQSGGARVRGPGGCRSHGGQLQPHRAVRESSMRQPFRWLWR